MELWRPVALGTGEILPGYQCPHCGRKRTHRSHLRGRLEGFLKSVTPLRPFSCADCRWRGWRVPVAAPAVELPPLPPHAKIGGPSANGLKRRPKPKTPQQRWADRLALVGLLSLVGLAGLFIWKGFGP